MIRAHIFKIHCSIVLTIRLLVAIVDTVAGASALEEGGLQELAGDLGLDFISTATQGREEGSSF